MSAAHKSFKHQPSTDAKSAGTAAKPAAPRLSKTAFAVPVSGTVVLNLTQADIDERHPSAFKTPSPHNTKFQFFNQFLTGKQVQPQLRPKEQAALKARGDLHPTALRSNHLLKTKPSKAAQVLAMERLAEGNTEVPVAHTPLIRVNG